MEYQGPPVAAAIMQHSDDNNNVDGMEDDRQPSKLDDDATVNVKSSSTSSKDHPTTNESKLSSTSSSQEEKKPATLYKNAKDDVKVVNIVICQLTREELLFTVTKHVLKNHKHFNAEEKRAALLALINNGTKDFFGKAAETAKNLFKECQEIKNK